MAVFEGEGADDLGADEEEATTTTIRNKAGTPAEGAAHNKVFRNAGAEGAEVLAEEGVAAAREVRNHLFGDHQRCWYMA